MAGKRGPTKRSNVQHARVKAVFDAGMEQIARGDKPNWYQLQREQGYAPSSAKSYMALRTNAWQKCLETIQDEKLVKRLMELVNSDNERISLDAVWKGLILKNRIPRTNSISATFTKKVNMLMEDDE